MKFKDKLSWTDDRIALLKRMWKEGKSAADIAKTLGKGVTRNAVIGKAHRMGLSGRPSPIKKPVETTRKSAAAPKKEAAPAKAAAPAPVSKKSAAPAKALPAIPAREAPEDIKRFDKEAIPPGGGVPLIDLTERMCKWPIGDPREADFTFCGRGIRQGTPYCPDHAAVAYQSSSRRSPVTHTVAPVAKEVEEVDEEAADDEEEVEESVG